MIGAYDNILGGSIHTMKKNTQADIAMVSEIAVFNLQYNWTQWDCENYVKMKNQFKKALTELSSAQLIIELL